jgi:hypothetical protein
MYAARNQVSGSKESISAQAPRMMNESELVKNQGYYKKGGD